MKRSKKGAMIDNRAHRAVQCRKVYYMQDMCSHPPFSVNTSTALQRPYDIWSSWGIENCRVRLKSKLWYIPMVPGRERAKKTNSTSYTRKRSWCHWCPRPVDPPVGSICNIEKHISETVHSQYDASAVNNQQQLCFCKASSQSSFISVSNPPDRETVTWQFCRRCELIGRFAADGTTSSHWKLEGS